MTNYKFCASVADQWPPLRLGVGLLWNFTF